jgi:DNA modification methylase
MNVKTVKISEVKQNPNNPRTIRDDKFERLVNSIKAFPEMLNIRPIVVNNDMVVLGGNMRLKACREAGLKQVPIIVAGELTEAQQREFIIKDNVSGGDWDWSALTSEWGTEQLEEWGLDIPEFETDKTLEAIEDDYEMPDEIQTDIVLGDLFEIGEHRLLCGDSTDSDAVARLMDGEKADMVFTDPPYKMQMDSGESFLKSSTKRMEVRIEKLTDFNPYSISHIIGLDVNAFYVCTSKDLIPDYFQIFKDFSFTILVWCKTNPTPFTNGTFLPDTEYILYFSRAGRIWNNSLKPMDIYSKFYISKKLEGRDGVGDLHPTMKPIQLISNRIKISSKLNGIVIDLFLGSGSTMVAAHQLKRKCYGMELDPKYCQVIVDRMRKLDPTLQIKRNGQAYTKTDELQTYGVSA